MRIQHAWPFLAAAALVSCVTETEPASPIRFESANPSDVDGAIADARSSINTLNVSIAVAPLGSVPCDDLSLPIVSPDGKFIATQVGLPPTYPTLRAEPDATVPTATSIEIYRLDTRTAIEPSERQSPEFIASINDPAILGRSCDERGFLIEAPQDDGSRWIGLASWIDGSVQWLVRDEYVNAFASLGADGRLAWSRRPVGDTLFEFVVQRAGEQWTFATGGSEWLYPTWGGRGDGLFGLHLAEDRLYVVYMEASSAPNMRRTLQQRVLATGADHSIAYQTLNGQVGSPATRQLKHDQLVFVHPARRRIAVWRPTARRNDPFVFLAPYSYAASIQEPNWAIVSTWKDLLRQSLVSPEKSRTLLDEIAVPRPVVGQEFDLVLLLVNPQGGGQIGLLGMKLLPPGGGPASARAGNSA